MIPFLQYCSRKDGALKMVVRTGNEHGGANNTSIFFAGKMFGRRSRITTPTVPLRRHATSL